MSNRVGACQHCGAPIYSRLGVTPLPVTYSCGCAYANRQVYQGGTTTGGTDGAPWRLLPTTESAEEADDE